MELPDTCTYMHVCRDGYVGRWCSILFVAHRAMVATICGPYLDQEHTKRMCSCILEFPSCAPASTVYFVCLYHPYIFLISLEIFVSCMYCINDPNDVYMDTVLLYSVSMTASNVTLSPMVPSVSEEPEVDEEMEVFSLLLMDQHTFDGDQN